MRKVFAGLLLAAAVLLVTGQAWGQAAGKGDDKAAPAKAAPEPKAAAPGDLVSDYQAGVRIKRLPNDLVIITKENHAAPVASVYVIVRAGGLLEQEYLGAGISHLTEHLVAGGSTANRTEDEIEKTIGDIGAVTNAFTAEDQTAYFIDTTPDHIGIAVELISDYIQHAKIDPKEFEREFGVVQREILNGDADVRRQLAYTLDEAMFPHLPQGLRVIGYYENIQKLTRDDVWKYYQRRYVPSNAVVCAAGDFDGAKVLADLEAKFGGWKGPHAPPVPLPEPSPPVTDIVVVREMDTQLAEVAVAHYSCQLDSPDLYPLDLLAAILGHGDSSRLPADLKIKRNLVYGITAYNNTPDYPAGQFVVTCSCDPEQVDAVRAAVAEHLERVCREAPTADEVEKVKRQVVAEHVLQTRTATSQARAMAAEQLSVSDPFFAARYALNIQKVTPEDILKAARKYLQGTRTVTVIVRPKAAVGAGEAVVAPPAKPATTRVVFPENGLTLLVHRTPGQPAVSLVATMKGGQTFETEATAGLSALTAEYLTRGTKTRSEEALAAFFDGLGGSIDGKSGWNSLYVQSIVLKGDFAKSAEVFADVVLHPAFAPDLLASTRERQLAGLKGMESDAVGQCAIFFGQQFFTGSPYRWPEVGTADSLKKITADDVRDFYSRLCVGKNMVIAVTGDLEPADVEKTLHALFKEIAPGQALEPPAAVKPRQVEDVEVLVKQSEKQGAVVMVGYPGTDLFNLRDRPAMDVFATIAAGYEMPRGWLHNTLRGQSLVYAVQFSGREGLLPGVYRAIALCQPDKVMRVARLMEDLLASGRDYAYTDDDLKSAKAIIAAARQMRQQHPEQVGLLMALNELYGLGYNFEDKYIELVNAVTVADVQRVVKQYVAKPVICITTPKPDLVKSEELRKPFEAARLQEMRGQAPDHVKAPRAHDDTQ